MPFPLPLCQVVPLPDCQVSLQIDGIEKARWHFDAKYPRPFFYPILGPSGETLTRMGHPGAQIMITTVLYGGPMRRWTAKITGAKMAARKSVN